MTTPTRHTMAIDRLLCLLGLLSLSASEPLLLTKETFQDVTSDRPCFVMFFAPWCGHCKRLGPTWTELATKYSSSSRIVIGKVDCTADTEVCSDEGVRGYPTLKLFVGDKVTQYNGPRDLSSLAEFVEQQTQTKEEDQFSPVELNDDSFQSFIAKDSLHFIMMYAPWCGHCKQLSPVWEELAVFYKSYDYIHISKIDCTKNKVTCERYRVTSYPTLLLFQNGVVVERYSGDRSLSSLIRFVDSSASPQEKPTISALLLTLDNFDDTIKEGVTFVMFFAPWCGHCQALSPTWQQLAELLHSTTHTTVAKVDCTKQTQLCDTHEVKGYPTLVLFVEGERRKEYTGARDLNSMQQFIDEHSY